MSGHEIETLVRFLDGASFVAEQAPRPETAEEADEVLSSLHQLMTTTEGLHDQIAGCYGALDAKGRCTECGRLVVKVHGERGCMMAVPFVGNLLWLLDNPESIPFLGKLLFLYKRRRSAAIASASGPGSASSPEAER